MYNCYVSAFPFKRFSPYCTFNLITFSFIYIRGCIPRFISTKNVCNIVGYLTSQFLFDSKPLGDKKMLNHSTQLPAELIVTFVIPQSYFFK